MNRITRVVALAATLLASTAQAVDSSGEVAMHSGHLGRACVSLTPQQSMHVAKVCMENVSARWKIGALLNEPTLSVVVKWDASPDIHLRSDSGPNGKSTRQFSSTVQAAFARLEPVGIKFAANVSKDPNPPKRVEGDGVGSWTKVLLDPGAMKRAGAGYSFNATGSPSWDDLFMFSPAWGPCLDGVHALNARKQTRAETQAMLKVGVSLSRLSLCEGGGFNGLSELDRALEENCEAWLPGSDRHKKCVEKKKPKPEKKAPETRLDNAQLAALDKALSKSTNGNGKGDNALDSALRQADFKQASAERGGRIQGKIEDAISGSPIPGVAINVSSGGENRARFTSQANGFYDIPLLPGTYAVSFEKQGYLPSNANVTVRKKEVTSLVRLRQIKTEHAGIGTIAGHIKNAFNGHPAGGVALKFYLGISSNRTQPAGEAVTDSAGYYSLSLPAGNYTIIGSAQNYSSMQGAVVSIGNRTTDGQNFAIPPRLPPGHVRIVLTWGSSPRDLDSHLTTPGGSHISFRSKSGPNVKLDVDNTHGYGPETITISGIENGEYRYYVEKYSGDSTLGNSDARVDVYGEAGLVRTFNVPPMSSGRTWNVFTFNRNSEWLRNGQQR